jgi:hypothetical protein
MPPREPSPARRPVHSSDPALQPDHAATLLRVLTASGYGLWTWLGGMLALGLHRIGHSGTVMPLALGAVLVSAGLLLAGLRPSRNRHWPAWHVRASRHPAKTLLLSGLSFVPVLLVVITGDDVLHAGLDRLAGIMLLLASLASLVYSTQRYRSGLSLRLQRASASLPVSRLVMALYGGGMWLWLCTMVQGGLEASERVYPWVLLLLILSLLLGFLEGMRWQSLHAPEVSMEAAADGLPPARFVAATLIYVIPCAALLLTERFGGGLLQASLAVPSCLLGKMLEQHSYETSLAAAIATTG